MREHLYRYYARLFAKQFFSRFNKFLYQVSLRGMGILNFEGEYLTGEKQWLTNYLESIIAPVVIDIGANIGTYSKHVLEANSSSEIYAFEPHPKTFKTLLNNLEIPNCRAFNSGLGSKNAELTIYDYSERDGSAHASLYRDVIKDLHKGNPVAHSVNIIRLDDFVQEHNISQIDLLKIDTEGNEFDVLMGAFETLKKNKVRAIHFEFNEMNVISGVNFKMFWDLLESYDFYRILPGGKLLRIKEYSPIMCEIYAYQNIVCLLR